MKWSEKDGPEMALMEDQMKMKWNEKDGPEMALTLLWWKCFCWIVAVMA